MSGTLVGRENVYTCEVCGAQLVTVDRDPGTTPFMVTCGDYNAGGCGGHMTSAFYPNGPRPPHISAPTHEWYRPNDAELTAECAKHKHRPGVPTAIREHVTRGGLLLRPIPSTVAEANG